jgi:hypothetical protein
MLLSGRVRILSERARRMAALILAGIRGARPLGWRAGERVRRLAEAGFLLAGAAFMFAGRLPAIVYPIRLNPDEVQMGANALRILRHGAGWGSLDGTTVGPLDSLVLVWPTLFGQEVSLVSVRLTAWMALSLVFVFSYLTIRRMSGRLNGVLFSLPLAVFFAVNESNEFQHYSSELLPAVLLTASLLLAVPVTEGRCRGLLRRSLGCGLLLGAVPFAKIQAVPVALVLGGFVAGSLVLSKCQGRGRALALLAAGPAFWCACFLLPLLLTGRLSTFYLSYVKWASLYVQERISLLALHRLIAEDEVLASVVYFVGALSLAAALLGRDVLSHPGSRPALAAAVAGAYAVMRPGNAFPHYLMLLVPFLVIGGGVTARLAERWKKAAFLALYVGLAFAQRGEVEGAIRRRMAGASPFATEPRYPLAMRGHDLFSWITDSRSDLFIWGWMPQWYLAAGMSPATREAHTNGQIVESPLRDYFRERLMEDLRRSAPEVIVDAVKPGSFVYDDSASQGIASFEALRSYVADRYAMVSDFSRTPECPDLYLRRDVFDERVGRVVVPAAVQSSPAPPAAEFAAERLFDSSVTEDSCVDYWLLPDGRVGHVDVTLREPAPIARVMVLNTQNGGYALDRAADLTRVELLSGGGVVAAREARLNLYPDWTAFEFEGAVRANALRVTVASFRGKGGGLNEIKIFRR